MFREEGEMDSHFWKHLWVILLNSSFGLYIFAKDHGHFSLSLSLSLSFKEDNPMSFLSLVFSEGAFEEFFLTLFEVDRHTMEIVVELSG